MSLKEYRRKRDFKQTTEPLGQTNAKQPKQLQFVIQKHDASRLHYDFRLELKGTLKSWAVPKGAPYKKGDRRLAMRVEDHPLSYAILRALFRRDNTAAARSWCGTREHGSRWADRPKRTWMKVSYISPSTAQSWTANGLWCE